MIAVNTSTWVAFLQGEGGEDAQLLSIGRWRTGRGWCSLQRLHTCALTPAADRDRIWLLATGRRVAGPGCWQKGRKACLGDALIAQSCIDQGISLLTRDRDFRALAEAGGLDLVIGSATGWSGSSSGLGQPINITLECETVLLQASGIVRAGKRPPIAGWRSETACGGADGPTLRIPKPPPAQTFTSPVRRSSDWRSCARSNF